MHNETIWQLEHGIIFSMTSSFESPSPSRPKDSSQIVAIFLGGIILFFLALLAWTLGYQLVYAGRIFPGVSVAGVDLSGMKPADAAITLNQRLVFPYQGQILLRDGERIWAASPAELGMVFDASASAQSAYKIGRSGGLFTSFSAQLDSLREGVSADAVIIFDQHLAYAYLQKLATEIDQPPVEASLSIQGTEVIAQPGQVGRYLNVDDSLLGLIAQLQSFRDGEVLLTVDEVHPQLVDVSSQAERARQILSAPLVLQLADWQAGDPGPWTFDAQTIAQMLLVRKTASGEASRLEVALDPSLLAEIIGRIAEEVNRPAQNARFVFNDETRQLDLMQNAVIGRVLDVETNVSLVNEAILNGAHEVVLNVRSDEPAVVDTSTAADLGITELVHSETSYFYGSSAARVQNIQQAAAAFHGILIAPGETFSMGSALGDISLDNGYAEALIIYGGRTIKGVGGGVCQVSTTLFRTAFFAGYPIVERHSHAYRVYYYEQNADGSRNPNLAGLDATVYVPLVDFKFTNDTPYWLLMETYTNAAGRNLTWKFYSTSDGRSMDWQTTGTRNIVSAPKPLFIESDELAKNEIKQVDWSAEGADVSITRQVFRDGELYFEDIFNTHYEPWQAVCEYGKGTKNPQKKAKEQGLCY